MPWDEWVVDNASTDDSVPAIRREFPHVRLVANATNGGFAAANNQGILACAGRYVLLLNSDTVMPPGPWPRWSDSRTSGLPLAWSARCWSIPTALSKATDAVPLLEDRITFGNGHRSPADPSGAIRAAPPGRARPHNEPTTSWAPACWRAERPSIQSAFWTSAISCIRRSPTGAGECGAAGGRLGTAPDARVTHFGGQSTRQVRDAMDRGAVSRSKVRFFQLHRGPTSARPARGVIHRDKLGEASGTAPAGTHPTWSGTASPRTCGPQAEPITTPAEKRGLASRTFCGTEPDNPLVHEPRFRHHLLLG